MNINEIFETPSSDSSDSRVPNDAAARARHYAEGLRQLAAWIEAHSELGDLPQTILSLYGLNEKEDAARLIRAMGSCKKRYGEEMFYVEKLFGPITLSAVFYRDKICTKRVVGVKTIPAYTVPEKTREIVEWDCEPILAPSED